MEFSKKSLAILVGCPALILANPELPVVVEGTAHFEGLNTAELSIHPSDRSIIHWESFSIGAHEITRFIQSSENATVLNRVSGAQMSELMGMLQADGKVYLINPNGVFVGKNGVVDVGSFIASSFDIPDSAFLNGEDLHFEGDSLSPIVNEGTVKANNGQILFFANRVENKGTLSSDDVFLGAGHSILVGVEDKQFLYVRPELPGDGIVNEGNIEAVRAVLATNGNPLALGIQNKGKIQAVEVVERNGGIYLTCKGSQVQNQGTLEAQRGEIHLKAQDALVENHGTIEAFEVSLLSFSDSLSLVDQKPLSNQGTITAETVTVNAPKFESVGTISSDTIHIFAPGTYLETARATLSGSEIKIVAGNYFSSGTILAIGGIIEIEGDRIAAAAAVYDGSKIVLTSRSCNEPLYLNSHVRLEGETITLNSPLPVDSRAQVKKSGVLSVPSTLSAHHNSSLFIDPNPAQEPLLWTFFAASKEKTEEGFVQLTSCPPLGVELVDPNPTGVNSTFGDIKQMLSTGNAVILKSGDSLGGAMAGAAYLYNASTGALISALRGSSPNDQVGSNGLTTLTNGNYVVLSSSWSGGAGAVTWASGTTGVAGSVGAGNSLIGSVATDQVGSRGVFPLTNGNYVVASPNWTNGGMGMAGAATWGSGTTGISGPVTTMNSLVGSQASDLVGSNAVTALTNGNYVVASSNWANGGTTLAGAATWGNGTTGIIGSVNTMNSLVGTTMNDQVADRGAVALTNGNYAVISSDWNNLGVVNNGLGAVTWVDGSNGIPFGAVIPGASVGMGNSLVGAQATDRVGAFSAVALNHANGNYVVLSPFWRNGMIAAVGAATWVNGANGIPFGAVSPGVAVGLGNSLHGSQANDLVSLSGIAALTNGNYVVGSHNWRNGAAGGSGAATWVDGSTGIPHGEVSAGAAVSTSNSIVGSQPSDFVGIFGTVALTNGNYVVFSPQWKNSMMDVVGAATWGNGASGTALTVGTGNSLTGSQPNDSVANNGVLALTNGNYVVASPFWMNGAASHAGAATWVNGTNGIPYGEASQGVPVSTSNSLVGTQMNDEVGLFAIALQDGNYVIFASNWDNGSIVDAGAVTWGNGTTGTVGSVSASNSFVGTQMNDFVGDAGGSSLGGSHYIIANSSWNNGTGAVTIGNSATGTFCDGTHGPVSSSNSFVGVNITSGLSGAFAPSNFGVTSAGDPVALFQFLDYAGETRVFVIPRYFSTPTAFSFGSHEFAIAISEAFSRTEYGWLSLEGALQRFNIYPPLETYKGLNLWLPSLITNEDDPSPRITYRGTAQ